MHSAACAMGKLIADTNTHSIDSNIPTHINYLFMEECHLDEQLSVHRDCHSDERISVHMNCHLVEQIFRYLLDPLLFTYIKHNKCPMLLPGLIDIPDKMLR